MSSNPKRPFVRKVSNGEVYDVLKALDAHLDTVSTDPPNADSGPNFHAVKMFLEHGATQDVINEEWQKFIFRRFGGSTLRAFSHAHDKGLGTWWIFYGNLPDHHDGEPTGGGDSGSGSGGSNMPAGSPGDDASHAAKVGRFNIALAAVRSALEGIGDGDLATELEDAGGQLYGGVWGSASGGPGEGQGR